MKRHSLPAGLLGFTAVALGAFGAHALKSRLQAEGFWEAWNTAVHYHLVHAVLLFAVSLLAGDAPRSLVFAARAWTAGILLFSGSLYLMSLTGIKQLGLVTPLGGLCLLAGWTGAAIWGFGQRTLPTKPSPRQMKA